MASTLSHRLTSSDAAFLYFERANAPLHIGSIGIYEGQIPFERFASHIESRLPNIPRYRQRVVAVPFSLAHPTWEDDAHFDINNHIHFATLPEPGNVRQLAELSGELFAVPLNRSHPLWEMFVINGLEGDRSAIISKVHHCMVDGVSGIDLLMQVVDLSPEPAPPPEAEPWQPQSLPGYGQRLHAAFWDNLREQGEFLRDWTRGMFDPQQRLRDGAALMTAMRTAAPWMTTPAPRTPFQVSIGKERRVAFAEMSFSEIREIRTTLGGTVNDVVLAVLAGGLRLYLREHGHKVDGLDLRVAIPVNVRLEDEKGALGNRVSAMFAQLPLGEANTLERFATVRGRMDQLKGDNQAGALERLIRSVSLTPVPVQALTGATAINNSINMICTNVPGPMIPLYCVGHLLLDHYPLVPLSLGMGLGVGVTSYNHRLFFGLVADPKAVPDIERLAQCVGEAFLELRGAAGVRPTDIPAFRGQSNGALAVAAMTGAPYEVS